MSTDQTPPSTPPKSVEVPLEDIDALLEAEDPGFTKELEAVRQVESDASLNIEASAIDDALGVEEKQVDKPEVGIKKYLKRFKMWRLSLRARIQARVVLFGKQSVQFLKTKPKEYLLYSIAILKIAFKKMMVPIQAFAKASRSQKILLITFGVVVALVIWMIGANIKGVWLPQLNKPMLQNLEKVADWSQEYNREDKSESFYSAFPQELHEFLFKKMKVNLKRTEDSPNPMGAFEIIVQLDSRDTAIETNDRQIEFHDTLQRVMEQESVGDLATEIGKGRVKNRIKKELNDKLTQGWIKDVAFKTFILKP